VDLYFSAIWWRLPTQTSLPVSREF